MAFSTCGVDNAIENTSGDGNVKSLPHIGSTARWERRMALSAAVTSMVAENHGWEFTVHVMLLFFVCGDFCLCEIFGFWFLVLCFVFSYRWN